MNSRLKIYQDEGGEWRWSLIAANGEPLAQGESHTSKHDAERAAATAARNMAEASETIDQDEN